MQDVLETAPTGSGKILAFLLSFLFHTQEGARAVFLLPARELRFKSPPSEGVALAQSRLATWRPPEALFLEATP